VSLHFLEIADVADVIPFAVFFDVFPLHGLSSYACYAIERLEYAARVGASPAEIINFTTARFCPKRLDEAHDIVRMNIVTYLLALIPKNFVYALLEIAFYEITEKPVKLDARMIWPRKATTAQAARLEREVTAVLLHHDVRCNFAGTE
jgi:hypothetical protein